MTTPPAAILYPYSRPDVTEADLDMVRQAASSRFLTQGPFVGRFEAALRTRLGGRHAIVCNSGTAALHLIYMALTLGPEAGLVTTPLTFLATANAARMCGAPVAFADTDPTTGLMTPETLRQVFRQKPFPVRAVAVVHLGGRVAELPRLAAVAAEHGAVLVEDACHAPGADYDTTEGRHPVGACAHSVAAAFSFHAIKHIAMGEGGGVLTNDPALAERMRTLRNHGMIRDRDHWIAPPEDDSPWYYEMHRLGWNYRADELACSLGLSQLARLDENIARRRALAATYDRLLADIPHLSPPPAPPSPGANAWHLYSVAIDFAAAKLSRGRVMRALARRGIGTQVHYIPVSSQPYYQNFAPKALPGAAQYYQRTLSIPLYPRLTEADQEVIANALREVLTR